MYIGEENAFDSDFPPGDPNPGSLAYSDWLDSPLEITLHSAHFWHLSNHYIVLTDRASPPLAHQTNIHHTHPQPTSPAYVGSVVQPVHCKL